jgi:hypothetical protein
MRRPLCSVVFCMLVLASARCRGAAMMQTPNPPLIPWPSSVTLTSNERFTPTKTTVIEVSPGQADLQRIAKDLADLLRPALDTTLTVRDAGGQAAANTIRL